MNSCPDTNLFQKMESGLGVQGPVKAPAPSVEKRRVGGVVGGWMGVYEDSAHLLSLAKSR